MRIFLSIIAVVCCCLSCKKTENVQQEMPVTSVTDSLMHNLRFEHSSKDEYQLKGFQEVVFSVADLEEASKTYREIAGWEVLYSGAVSAAQLAAWQLPDTARAREMLLRNPGDREGFLRLVQFSNVPQRQIRSSAQPWDTGGIFDVNIRITDMDSIFYELQSGGWNAYHDPVAFKFGKFHVEEVLVRGHDGVVLAMIQRHAPPLEGYPNLKKMSHIFNATQIVTDMDKSLDFYRNGLGFKMYMQHKGASTAAGENVLGLPYNLTDDYERSVCILHPEGTNFGSVELLQFHGISGKDHAAFAVPPHLGILMQRFPVANIAVFSKKIRERGIVIRQPVTTLELPPYGKVKSLAVQTPDGAWLEFIALAN